MRKFALFCFASLCLALFLSPCLSARAQETAPRRLVYTALGDSIATGYKLKKHAECYVSLYGAYLDADTADLGQNGLDSTGLLKKLQTDKNMIRRLQKSDVVTVSMGGNDLLPIFAKLRPASVLDLIADYHTLAGRGIQQKTAAAVARFKRDWPKIIARIRELCPHADVIVTTLINPYQKIRITVPVAGTFDLGTYTNRYVKEINAVIAKDAGRGYLVADSYALFRRNSGKALTNADLASLDFDPHPNRAGHRLIYDAHRALGLCFADGAVAMDGPDAVTLTSSSAGEQVQYAAYPTLTCFTAGSRRPEIVYSLTDSSAAGASVDPETGILTVSGAGTVTIRATLSLPGTHLSARGEKTVTIRQILPSSSRNSTAGRQGTVPAVTAASAVLLVFAAALLLLYKKAARR